MNSNSTKKSIAPLKIALISDSTELSVYILQLVKWAKSEPDIELDYYLLHTSDKNPQEKSKFCKMVRSIQKYGIRRSISSALFRLITWFEYLKQKKNEQIKNHQSIYSILDSGLTIVEINPIVSKAGKVHEFNEDDINKVKLLNLDLIVHCGFCVLQGPILTASKLGILSIHCGNYFQYRGCPEGFWEVFDGTDSTGFVIHQLTNELNAGIVFFQGFMETKGSWLLNQANIYSKSMHYFKDFLKKLAITKELPNPSPGLPYSRIPHNVPDVLDTMRYVWMRIKKRAKNTVKSEPVWHVAFVHTHWREASLFNGIELPALPGKGLADPFLFSKNGRDYCFVEEIDNTTRLGSIAVYELFQTSAVRLGTAIKEEFHLSFPYIFEYDGQVLMLPETHQNQDIRLYQCVDFPLQWKLKHVLIKNISAVDTLLFNKDNKWWLFTNANQSGEAGYYYEMSIFSSNSPFSNDWHPHSSNPVYVDNSRARNGGFFKSDNRLYRVSQSQGIDNYGKFSIINEIIELTEDSFREVKIVQILPNFKKGIIGTHHFHTNGSITVFDYKN